MWDVAGFSFSWSQESTQVQHEDHQFTTCKYYDCLSTLSKGSWLQTFVLMIREGFDTELQRVDFNLHLLIS